jgi:aldehyde:ferredoxin oxidoreductase
VKVDAAERRINMQGLKSVFGKMLRVDLSTGTCFVEKAEERALNLFMGGAGLAADIILKETEAKYDPLGSEAPLVIATGPLTGTGAPGCGSVDLCFKSPLTGVWGESRSGSDFGPALRKAGIDVVVITGRAEEPSVLIIDEGSWEVRPWPALKGLSTSKKTKAIKDELGGDFEVGCIGPAGENLVKFASVMFGDASRAAGRSGAGTVMGSKNLLAVAVRGKKKVPIREAQKFMALCRDISRRLISDPGNAIWAQEGTTGELARADAAGDFPTKNWEANSWGKGAALFKHFQENNFVSARPCYKGCILRCGRKAKVDKGPWMTPCHEGCEYETMTTFTAYLLNEDVDAAVHASWLCNEFGLDTISAGSVLAFAMDCFEKGILKPSDNEGSLLEWGNMEETLKLLRKIASREGLGDLLADGVRSAASELGKGAQELAVHVKGLEGPAHDPRSGKALGLSYGVANTGMNHIHPIEGMAWDSGKMDFGLISYGLPDPNEVDRYEEEGKGKAVKLLHDFGMLPDILGFCKFYVYAGVTVDDLADLMTALTGEDFTGEELLKVGERAYNAQRAFNVREGVSKEDDLLPKKILSQPAFGKYAQKAECVISDYDKMLMEYYQARGWDENGRPTREKLKELGLDYLVR